MNENVKKLVLIASVVLNAVFAAAFIAARLPSLAGGHHLSAPKGPLFLQLDLKPDQLSRLEVERDEFHGRLQELGQDIKTKQTELIELLRAEPPDQQAINRKKEEIQHLQAVVQDRVIVHFLKASSFLTSAQRARFFDLIKQRIETGARTCPPLMKPFEQDRRGENLAF